LILTGVILVIPKFTGGELGISGVGPLSGSRIVDYYIMLFIMLFSLLIMWKLTDEKSRIIRIGIILRAIREDEITARMSGINTTNYKLVAFAASGFFAGISGGLYTHFVGIAGPSTLELFLSFQCVLWTIFGGLATIYGPVAGVFILFPFVEFLRLFESGERIRFILLGLVMIFTLLYMPEGLIVWFRDKLEVICLRCKVVNMRTRSSCRLCHAPLLLEKKKSSNKDKCEKTSGIEID
jgi:branched-chain amino acid transport system permease protein